MKKSKSVFSRISAGMKTRSFRVGGYSVAACVIVIAIAIVVNVLVDALPSSATKIDVSSQKLYSLSEETENLLDSLDQDITIYWIVQTGKEDTTLQLLLDNYKSAGSHISVVEKDPDVSPTFVQQYYSDGSIYNNSLVVCAEDGRSRNVAYSDIYVYDYSNYYTTGTADVSFDGEGALTSAISYLTQGSLPKMYVLTGHGESTMSSSFQSAVEKQNIETEELSLLTAGLVPEDADCLLIYAPDSDISEDETAALADYLAGGGKLILLSKPLDDGSTLPNLYGLIESYGLTLTDGIVIEGNSDYYYSKGYPYYLLPKLQSHDITDPLITGGYYVLLPLAQGLTISDEIPDGVDVTNLLDTSDSAFCKMAGYAAETYDKEAGDVDGPFTLAAAIDDSNSGAQIVWVTSDSLLDDTTNSYVSGGNEDFFLNAVNWMCGQESGITVHAKSINAEYLTMSSTTATILIIVMIVVLPVAYLVVGIVIRRKRKLR